MRAPWYRNSCCLFAYWMAFFIWRALEVECMQFDERGADQVGWCCCFRHCWSQFFWWWCMVTWCLLNLRIWKFGTSMEIGIDAQGRDPDITTSQSSSTKEQLHCLQQRYLKCSSSLLLRLFDQILLNWWWPRAPDKFTDCHPPPSLEYSWYNKYEIRKVKSNHSSSSLAFLPLSLLCCPSLLWVQPSEGRDIQLTSQTKHKKM